MFEVTGPVKRCGYVLALDRPLSEAAVGCVLVAGGSEIITPVAGFRAVQWLGHRDKKPGDNATIWDWR